MNAVAPRPLPRIVLAPQPLPTVRTDDMTAALRHCQAAEVLLTMAKVEPDDHAAARWLGEAHVHASLAQARATVALAMAADKCQHRAPVPTAAEDDLTAVFDALGIDADGCVRA